MNNREAERIIVNELLGTPKSTPNTPGVLDTPSERYSKELEQYASKPVTVEYEDETYTPDESLPVHEQLEQLDRAISAISTNRQREKEAHALTKSQTLASEERKELHVALRNHGVSQHAARSLVALLHTERKAVSRDFDGEILLTLDGEEYSLTDGVKKFLDSDEGKGFKPEPPKPPTKKETSYRMAREFVGAPAKPLPKKEVSNTIVRGLLGL